MNGEQKSTFQRGATLKKIFFNAFLLLGQLYLREMNFSFSFYQT